ncbi:CcmD family protein [Pontibacter sp. SGAir0037]|uniref:CcmD family protein n=1 Tax=Pontibacter sp. SGAir0037 TaxID=2571030 RepID=UPI0010CD21FC|nr:hypothetical protein [Pontibacter sp. SGAir0037]QCR23677.1 hypothetical protein C1N53_15890 [Pontibacter sp. SGAir0037]
MKVIRILALCCFMLTAAMGLQTAQAQTPQSQTTAVAPEVEMADLLRQDGKIYVVIAVILTVLAGLIFYLISIDRKVGKLEKQLKEELVNR